MTSSFDSLFESLLNELSPVAADFDSFGTSLEKGIGSEKTGGYLIKDIADALSITKEDAVKKIVKDLYDDVFGQHEGNINPSSTEKEYRADIATALEGIVNKIKEEHPEAKSLKNYDAYRGYTARVISKLAAATKDFGDTVTREIVNTAVEDTAKETEGLATDGEEGIEDEQETLSSEFGDQNTLEEPEADENEEGKDVGKEAEFSPRTDYFLNPEDDIKAGTLSGDLRSVYDRLGGLAGETRSGEEIADKLRKAGIPQSKIGRYLKELIIKGVLEPQTSDEAGGGGALEGSEENMRDVEKDTFNRHFSDAYNDYIKSGGGELSGRESNYE